MFWQHMPRTALAWLPSVVMLVMFIMLRGQGVNESTAFALAFGLAFAVRLLRSLATESPASLRERETQIAVAMFVSVLGSFLWLGTPSYTLRFFQMYFGMMVFAALAGLFLEKRIIALAFPRAAGLRALDWLNGMLLHLACFWICALEYMIYLAHGDALHLAFVASLCLIAPPMSLNILITLALMREKWGVEDP